MMTRVKRTLERLAQWREREIWLWIGALVLAGAAAFLWDRTQSQSVDPAAQSGHAGSDEIAAVDTRIPAGFVLVPIQIANFESLDSILGRTGVVDLFLPSADGVRPARRVAERIRILRSPKDPSHFAVLAPESESHRLVTHEGAFVVAVQNPKARGAAFEIQAGKLQVARKTHRLRVERIDDEQN